MNPRLLTGAGGLFLLAAAIVPGALGHDDRAVISSVHTIPGTLGTNDDGVSGRYVGAAGPAVAIEASNNPQGTLASGGILYDAEVITDSNTVGQGGEDNEPNVDGSATVGQQPINFWDDGGQGGAGHTNSYTTAIFNTPGCQTGQTANGQTYAGTDIWIGAACDWKETEGGDPILPLGSPSEETLLLCLVNAALAFNPLAPPVPFGAVGEAQAFVDCASGFAGCLLNPTCGQTGSLEVCVPDGQFDAINFGYGSGGPTPAAFPVDTGDPGPPACPVSSEAASIFVFDTVATNGGASIDPDGPGGLDPVYTPDANTTVDVYLALAGELWSDF